MRKSAGMRAILEAAVEDPLLMEAVHFDEGAAHLGEGEAKICKMDSAPLKCIRSIGMSDWKGEQRQFVCPLCSAKYVQFKPDER